MNEPWYLFALHLGSALGGLTFTVWGFYFGWQKLSNKEEKKLETARTDLIAILESEAKAWRAKYDLEHSEYVIHRDRTHEQVNQVNAQMLKLTNENTALQARTDMTSVTQALTDQTKSLTLITTILTKLEAKLEHHQTNCMAYRPQNA